MKNLKDILEKSSVERLTPVCEALGIKRRSAKTVFSSLQTASGITQVMESLPPDSIKVLELIYSGNDGVNFGEIEKKLHISIVDLEDITKNLSDLFLISTMKNRQLLNNKLDKVYGLKELEEWFIFLSSEQLTSHLKTIRRWMSNPPEKTSKLKIDDNEQKLIRHIILAGGISHMEELQGVVPASALAKNIDSLISRDILQYRHLASSGFGPVLLLCQECAGIFTGALLAKDNIKKNISVNNRYGLLVNMLNSFDTITTYGLFLTKQMEFRKIDKRRIIDAMIPLGGEKGEMVDPELSADLALCILNRLGYLKQQKDIATITFNQAEKEINEPERFLNQAVKALNNQSPDQKFFPSPLALLSQKDINEALALIDDISERTYIETMTILYNWVMVKWMKKNRTPLPEAREELARQTSDLVTMLLVSGLTDISDGHLLLSQVGGLYLRKSSGSGEESIKQAIYINPDLSLMIPVREIPPHAHYFLLAFTEITNDDVMLQVEVQKNSVVRAHKRGMDVEKFLDVLRNYAKNDIPQNLQFLLNDWSEQTIMISINGAILLKTNHPTFIENILLHKAKDAVIERISEYYAVIDREQIDTIVKLAKKENAVISLFEEHTVTD